MSTKRAHIILTEHHVDTNNADALFKILTTTYQDEVIDAVITLLRFLLLGMKGNR